MRFLTKMKRGIVAAATAVLVGLTALVAVPASAQAPTYTVTFNANGGQGAVEPRQGVFEGVIAEPTEEELVNLIAPQGKMLAGWLKPDPTHDGPSDELWDFANDMITADTVLYANWVDDPNYNPNNEPDNNPNNEPDNNNEWLPRPVFTGTNPPPKETEPEETRATGTDVSDDDPDGSRTLPEDDENDDDQDGDQDGDSDNDEDTTTPPDSGNTISPSSGDNGTSTETNPHTGVVVGGTTVLALSAAAAFVFSKKRK